MIQNIKYFLALCEEKHFGRAAKRCGISQPSLTNAIKRLEDNVGGRLFERTRSAASVSVPTGLALAVKPWFEQALSALERAQTAARKHHTAGLPARSLISRTGGVRDGGRAMMPPGVLIPAGERERGAGVSLIGFARKRP